MGRVHLSSRESCKAPTVPASESSPSRGFLMLGVQPDYETLRYILNSQDPAALGFETCDISEMYVYSHGIKICSQT